MLAYVESVENDLKKSVTESYQKKADKKREVEAENG